MFIIKRYSRYSVKHDRADTVKKSYKYFIIYIVVYYYVFADHRLRRRIFSLITSMSISDVFNPSV